MTLTKGGSNGNLSWNKETQEWSLQKHITITSKIFNEFGLGKHVWRELGNMFYNLPVIFTISDIPGILLNAPLGAKIIQWCYSL